MGLAVEPTRNSFHAPPPPLPPRRASSYAKAGPSGVNSNNNNKNRTPTYHTHRHKPSTSSQEDSVDTTHDDNDHDGADINSDISIDSADTHYHDSSTDDSEHQRQLWEAMGVLNMQVGI